MDILEYKDSPILAIYREANEDSVRGRALRAIGDKIRGLGFSFVMTSTPEDGERVLSSNFGISCVAIDQDMEPIRMIKAVRAVNKTIPIFLIGDKLTVVDLPDEMVKELTGYVWPMEDTPDFIAGRVETAAQQYIKSMLPPFFGALLEYTYQWKYAWHTPGHMGGIAFRKSPPGRLFYDFLGENVFRADLSVSVPELGSLLEHSGVVGQAERQAARTFGADYTYFVTNGTSTSNHVVFNGTVTAGDVVLTDRNCHKSAMQGIILSGGIPTYFIPTRNQYGIIGPIHNKSFEKTAVEKMIKDSPIIKGSPKSGRLTMVTNSTYDGICYNVQSIKKKMKDTTDFFLFDEAWYGYAQFHPLYSGRFAMHREKDDAKLPTLFATQSTHKVLAAFSQASMIHVKDGKTPLNEDCFNEAYMMHTSTSPQYEIIASLDVATKMMMVNGEQLLAESMEEAVEFRKRMAELYKHTKKKKGGWGFRTWQPDKIKGIPFEKVPTKKLLSDPGCWTLDPNAKWHGFGNLEKNHAMLDPIKVTILTPGIAESGKIEERGIPAAIVSRFLCDHGIVVEKTGYYSFLVLFTIGVTKGKSATLLNALAKFKQQYDENLPLHIVFPHIEEGSTSYAHKGLRDICDNVHKYLKNVKIYDKLDEVFSKLPEPAMPPIDAYNKMVKGKVDKVSVHKLKGRIAATMVVPYPPGIPIMMPGEKFGPNTQTMRGLLEMYEDFDNTFPSFEHEIHGIIVDTDKDGTKHYSVYCLV